MFPEAFAQNELVLPLGSVCDRCNNYLGVELDSVFVSHPILSAMAQFLRFPGKSGKLRQRFGNVELDVDTGAHRTGDLGVPRSITIPCAEPEIVTGPDGSRTATAQPLIDPRFDFRRFRRAIYHILFNAYAAGRGVSATLESRFDPVRNYIRKPRPREAWPFAQFANLAGFNKKVLIVLDDDEADGYAGMVICAGMAFGVDLLNRGNLPAWVKRNCPPGTQVIGVDHHLPRAPRPGKRDPEYFVTIFLDE